MMTDTQRKRLTMICTGMLYFGAMLAGLSRHGWAAVLAFLVVFVIWLAGQQRSRPPARPVEWLRGATLARNGLRIAAQLALVIFCFALGRGVGPVGGGDGGIGHGLQGAGQARQHRRGRLAGIAVKQQNGVRRRLGEAPLEFRRRAPRLATKRFDRQHSKQRTLARSVCEEGSSR